MPDLSPSSEPATLRARPLLRGIDVSSHQGIIDWPAVAASGVRFAIVKATEGATYTDPRFVDNWSGARAAGLSVGIYHFFKATSSTPEAQAENLLNVYRSVEGFVDLPIAIDVEEIGRGQTSADLVRRVLAFVAIIRNELGADPMLYSYSAFGQAHFAGSEAAPLASLPLWLADYRAHATVPPPWFEAGKGWAIWQHSDKGRVDGIRGDVDLDVIKTEALGLAEQSESG